MRIIVTFALFFFTLGLMSQTEERAIIEVLYGGRFLKDEVQFPGASVFKKTSKVRYTLDIKEPTYTAMRLFFMPVKID
jgi:hypothetical protein